MPSIDDSKQTLSITSIYACLAPRPHKLSGTVSFNKQIKYECWFCFILPSVVTWGVIIISLCPRLGDKTLLGLEYSDTVEIGSAIPLAVVLKQMKNQQNLENITSLSISCKF